jgi:hypothetical protein
MELFGKKIFSGPVAYDDGRVRIDGVVEKIAGGYRLTGAIRGRAGRIEVFRSPAPREFLMNNWQVSRSGWRITADMFSRRSRMSSSLAS